MNRQGDIFQKIKMTTRGQVLVGEPLAQHTSFKIGGPADFYVKPADEDDLHGLIGLCQEEKIESFVIGRGTNLLVSDAGFRGVVIDIADTFTKIQLGERAITVGAGVLLDDLVVKSIEWGLSGLENLSGIPGSIGGGIRLNAGAFGTEIKDPLESVKVVDEDNVIEIMFPEQLNMQYRQTDLSVHDIVIEARFHLNPGEKDELEKIRKEILTRRKEKQPLSLPSAGSVFKRPKGDYAGRLIEECGLKGLRIGDAMISKKHANFIVNCGHASASDVKRVIAEVQSKVRKQFQTELEPEVHFLGFEETDIKS